MYVLWATNTHCSFVSCIFFFRSEIDIGLIASGTDARARLLSAEDTAGGLLPTKDIPL